MCACLYLCYAMYLIMFKSFFFLLQGCSRYGVGDSDFGGGNAQLGTIALTSYLFIFATNNSILFHFIF